MDATQPAFPQSITYGPNGDAVVVGHYFEKEGLTIRAYIATKALAAIINAEYGATVQRLKPQQAAEDAVTFADALIDELSKEAAQ